MKRLSYLMLVVLGTMAFAGCSRDEVNIITMVSESTDCNFMLRTDTRSEHNISVTVDWGDGTKKRYSSAPSQFLDHTYTDGKNSHTIKINGTSVDQYRLTEFICDGNQLTALNLNCSGLKSLNCYNNQLTRLNTYGCTDLIKLNCYSNKLTSLDVSMNTALEILNCYNNQLTSLDVSNNTALFDLDCRNNQFTAAEMNKIYEALPTLKNGHLHCDRLGNPNIATQKGWFIMH